MCGPRGVESCRVPQTWRIKRLKNGLTLWSWIDGPMSCSCNEDPYWHPTDPKLNTPWWVPLIPLIPFLTPWPDPY
jgi:hypothetical protein